MDTEIRALLEAASVAGEPGGLAVRFTLNEAAAGLDSNPANIEYLMERYARNGHFLRALEVSDWPDGSLCHQYEFAHALYQNVIYRQISVMRRGEMHRRIANCLEKDFLHRGEEIAGKLAVHREQSGDYLAASRYLRRSAVAASGVGSHREAMLTLQKAEQLLAKLPETLERNKQELAVLHLLAQTFVAVHGNAFPQLEVVYGRALELCEHVPEAAERFPLMFGLRSYYLTVGDYDKALHLASELLAFAQSEDNSDMLLEAEVGLASCQFYLGDIEASFRHALAGIALYSSQLHSHHATTFGLDPGTFCYARAGQTAWALGKSDQAVVFALQGVTCSQKIQHAYSETFARHNLTLIYLHCRQPDVALESAELGWKLAEQQGFGFLAVWGRYLRAWALAINGDANKARDEIAEALSAPRPNAPTTESFLNVFLAQAYWYLEDWQNGLPLVEHPSKVQAYEAERLWLFAQFNLQKAENSSNTENQITCHAVAEQLYREALALSLQQSTLAYSGRILRDLIFLLKKSKRSVEAAAMLAEYLPLFETDVIGTQLKAEIDEIR